MWMLNSATYYLIAAVIAIATAAAQSSILFTAASVVSDLFMNCLRLVSIPIIFLSIVSTAGGMEGVKEVRALARIVVKYTLMTTLISATVALILFLAIDPVGGNIVASTETAITTEQPGYWGYLMEAIPSNAVKPFSDGHVIAVLFLAVLLSISMLSLPEENKRVLHSFFSSLYAAMMKITSWIVIAMPIAVWAFLTLFLRDINEGPNFGSLALYLCCVLAANAIQGLVVLPILLKIKGIPPWAAAKGMAPALSLAFFTKSSAAVLPTAIKCSIGNLKVSKKVANFVLPLCTSINMYGCAAFILITVLFVSMTQGMTYSLFDMTLWIFISTIAAVGNAGVPMGCFFLSSAFLAAMQVPLNIMGVILPFYALIDMVETSLNVWSDACVTAIVQKELPAEVAIDVPEFTENPNPLPTRCC